MAHHTAKVLQQFLRSPVPPFSSARALRCCLPSCVPRRVRRQLEGVGLVESPACVREWANSPGSERLVKARGALELKTDAGGSACSALALARLRRP